MSRLLIFGLIVLAIWFLFFRKKNKIPKDVESLDMIECSICKDFISKDDAIFANGRWYCSKECLLKKD